MKIDEQKLNAALEEIAAAMEIGMFEKSTICIGSVGGISVTLSMDRSDDTTPEAKYAAVTG